MPIFPRSPQDARIPQGNPGANARPPAPNAPRLINFTGDPYFGTGLKNIDVQRQALAEQVAAPLEQQIQSPWQGAAFLANKLGAGIREGMASSAEAATRDQLAGLIGGIDLSKGPTSEQIAQAMRIDPEYGNALYESAVKLREEQAKTAATAAQQGQWKPSDLGSLRDDYMKAALIYNTAAPSWQSMKEAAAIALDPASDNGGKGTADYNMIVAFAKLLDPNSVVREGEVASASMTEGMVAQFNGWLQQFTKQGSLPPEVRRAIMTQAQSRMQAYYDQAKQNHDWITGIATRHNVNPDDVVPPLAAFQGFTAPKADDTTTKKPDTTTPDVVPPRPRWAKPDDPWPTPEQWKKMTPEQQQDFITWSKTPDRPPEY